MEAWLSLGAGGLLTCGWVFYYLRVWRPEEDRQTQRTEAWIKRLETRVEDLEGRLVEAEAKAESAETEARQATIATEECERRERTLRQVLVGAGLALPEF